MKPSYQLYKSTQYCEYREFRSWGKLRCQLNRTHNSKLITPKLKKLLDIHLDDESKFHESGWKQAMIAKLYDFIIKCDSKRKRFEGFLDILNTAIGYTNSSI